MKTFLLMSSVCLKLCTNQGGLVNFLTRMLSCCSSVERQVGDWPCKVHELLKEYLLVNFVRRIEILD